MMGEGWVTSSSSRGQALRGNNGRERGFHCGMTGDTGTGGSRTAPTGEGAGAWGQSIFIAITGEGAHEGRPYGGWGAGEERGRGRDGSPHVRGQPAGGWGAWRNVPVFTGAGSAWNNGRERGFHCGMTGDTGTGGSRTARTERGKTRASAAWGQSIFIAITGEGAHEGRPYGAGERGRRGDGGGMGPPCARTTEGEGDDGGGMGPRIREDNGGMGGSRTAPTGEGAGAWGEIPRLRFAALGMTCS